VAVSSRAEARREYVTQQLTETAPTANSNNTVSKRAPFLSSLASPVLSYSTLPNMATSFIPTHAYVTPPLLTSLSGARIDTQSFHILSTY